MDKAKAIEIFCNLTDEQLEAILSLADDTRELFEFYDCYQQSAGKCKRTNGKRWGIACEVCIARHRVVASRGGVICEKK